MTLSDAAGQAEKVARRLLIVQESPDGLQQPPTRADFVLLGLGVVGGAVVACLALRLLSRLVR